MVLETEAVGVERVRAALLIARQPMAARVLAVLTGDCISMLRVAELGHAWCRASGAHVGCSYCGTTMTASRFLAVVEAVRS